MTDITSQTPICQFRRVSVFFIPPKGGLASPRDYIIHESEVETFVSATKRLHVSPGVNPHNGRETSRISQIVVGELKPEGPYWWTTEDLKNNHDPSGARVMQGNSRVAWCSSWEKNDDRQARPS